MMQNDFGLISIIMAAYNAEKTIEQAINSVLSQTYPDFELLVVNDCSTDKTAMLAEAIVKKDDRVRLISNEKNSGVSYTRKHGLEEASGEWVAILDSDDAWAPEKLEKQIAFMEENDYHFSYTDYMEIDEASKPNGKSVTGPKKITKAGMFNYCWPGCLTVMYDAETVGLIQIADIKKNNDYAMWLKVCKKADCYLIDEVLAKYRKRTGSISNHGYMKLVKWHYKLFREAENQNPVSSTVLTIRNLLFGVFKKIKYVKG